MGERFEIDGWVWYEQGRRCGKGSCKVCGDGGAGLHGPYWYRREVDSGRVVYVGKELPEEAARARGALAGRAADMRLMAAALERQARVLGRAAAGFALAPAERMVVEGLGFGVVLVRWGEIPVVGERALGRVVQPASSSMAQEGARSETGPSR